MAAKNLACFLWTSFVYIQLTEIGCQEHIGCHRVFNTSVGSIALGQFTLTWCQTLCRTATYFGLRLNGSMVNCACSNPLPDYIDVQRNCDQSCNGNTCGGSLFAPRQSLYTTCTKGRFGSDPLCGRGCHCRNNAVCQISDGQCPVGCQDRWTGSSCDICEMNWQGQNCDICAHNWEGTNCDRCAPSWNGTNCDRCAQNWAEPSCSNCVTGWQGNTCQQDVDECSRGLCEQDCVNSDGSFSCSCYPGYQLEANNRNCTERDECASNPCGRHRCVDAVDNYTCDCNDGFRQMLDGKGCTDIDECSKPDHGCQHNCSNSEGSYECLCRIGYKLESNKSCTEHLSPPEAGSQSAYIGAGVGGALLLCAVVVVTVIMVKRRRLKPHDDDEITGPRHDANTLIPLDTAANRTEDVLYSQPKPSPQPSQQSADSLQDDEPVAETRISVNVFSAYVKRRQTEESPFAAEFKRLPDCEAGETVAAKRPGLSEKNRFKNILPYDANRVQLTVIDGDPLSDYVNASFIQFQASSTDSQFIATIGPTNKSIEDFWRMIWEQKVSLIAMVTRLQEAGVSKCSQYWPDGPEGSSEDYKDISVELNKEDLWMDNVLRKFKVKKGSETRNVTQMHFTSWPDHGVPHNATSMTNFVARVRRKMAPHKATVVHCSAGVGRTGTLIALHLLLKQAKEEGVIDVFSCVSKLRQQRMHMVQSRAQYAFLHDALAEVLTTGETSISCDTFTDSYSRLATSDTIDKVKKIQAQFQLLLESQPGITDEIKSYALSKQNEHKNRDMHVLPIPGRRPFLLERVPGRNDYINASVVGGYRKPDAFLTTQVPLEGTVIDYWRLIVDNNCRAIVLLKGEEDPQDLPMFIPEKNMPFDIHKRTVKFHSEKTKDGILIKEMYIADNVKDGDSAAAVYANVETPSSEAKGIKLKVFCIPAVQGSTLNPDHCISTFLQLQDWQHRNGDKPVVVTCLNGASLSGQYVVCSNLFEMANTEGEVDIYQMVRHAKDCQPMFVNTLEQYTSMYEAVQVYLDSFEKYQNFK